ncbi:MAG: HNH endonuclease family protein [Ilumatobacteraceae bacterium]
MAGHPMRRTARALVAMAAIGLAAACTIEPDSAGDDTAALADVTTSNAAAGTTNLAVTSTSAVSPSTTGRATTVPASSAPATTVPATTAPPATAVDPRPLALDVLALIPIELEQGAGYDRDLFDHWITRNGCTTRESVLIRDSLSLPQVDAYGCTVVAGDWLSPYDGGRWSDPSDVDIDHVVALKEAWDSGAWAWDSARRRAFANDLTDPRSLRAVTDNVNQSKSDADPSNWMPPLRTFWCTYLGDWVAIKARWGLSMDQSEWGRVRNLLRDECPGWRIEPLAPAPA